jgi:hypothetical protein
MPDLFRAIAAPLSVEVAGKKWEFHPLTLLDWAKLDQWCEDKIFADLKKRLEVLPGDAVAAKQKLLDRIALMMRRELAEEVFAMKYSATGMVAIQRALLMLKHSHPDVTEKDAEQLVSILDFSEIEMRLEGSTGTMNQDLLIAVKRVVNAKLKKDDVEEAKANLDKVIDAKVRELSEIPFPAV